MSLFDKRLVFDSLQGWRCGGGSHEVGSSDGLHGQERDG